MLAGAIPVTFEKNLVSVLPFPDLIAWGQLVITLNNTAVASGSLFGSLKVLAVCVLLVLEAQGLAAWLALCALLACHQQFGPK